MPKTSNEIKELGRPIPGHRIRVALVEVSDCTAGGIYKPHQVKRNEELTSGVGQVVAVGPTAYTGEQFAGHAWVKPGDWVLLSKFAGRKYRENGKPFVVVNDDEVIDVIPNPSAIADF